MGKARGRGGGWRGEPSAVQPALPACARARARWRGGARPAAARHDARTPAAAVLSFPPPPTAPPRTSAPAGVRAPATDTDPGRGGCSGTLRGDDRARPNARSPPSVPPPPDPNGCGGWWRPPPPPPSPPAEFPPRTAPPPFPPSPPSCLSPSRLALSPFPLPLPLQGPSTRRLLVLSRPACPTPLHARRCGYPTRSSRPATAEAGRWAP